MTTPFKSNSKRTEPSTQKLPAVPTVQVIETWDKKKVLQWILKRKPNTLEGDDLDNFKNARIDGIAFLDSSLEFFHQTCRLSPGVSLGLMRLVNEVKEGKPSNQTAGRKRKGNETDASEASTSPKRIRQEDPLWKSATRARKQRELIRKFITNLSSSSNQHSKSVHPLPGAVDKLSDPTFEGKLAFPFIGRVPERFKIDNKQKWPYAGRIMFRKLIEELKMVREGYTYTAVWLYGTQGYGKSHLLAVLACYLAAQDERVIYIPDCRAWLRNPIGGIKKAMLFAWADEITTQEEIETWRTEVEIEDFLMRQSNVLFIVDQLNALTESNGSNAEILRRGQLYSWLMRFTSDHIAVFSSSANYKEFVDKSKKQTSNRVVPVYGGLERAEMDQWWERHRNIDMAGYDESDVEDTTGRIPLLLEKCLVNEKIDLTVADLRIVYNKAVKFVQEVRDKTTGHLSRWQWYLNHVKACICKTVVPAGVSNDLIDHRYFFERDGYGDYSCGLVRDAVGHQLLFKENFADTDFLLSLPSFIDNRSVAGFMIEHAVLSSIRSKGLAIGEGIKKSMDLRPLELPIDFEKAASNSPVLYLPQVFNFKAIDGIIVFIKPDKPDGKEDAKEKKKKLLMLPLQITLAPATHANSREQFFKEYCSWITKISKFDVEVQFLWITPECRHSQVYPADPEQGWPRHRERYITFKDVDKRIWEKYEDAQKRLPKDEAAQKKLLKTEAAQKTDALERATPKGAAPKRAAPKTAAPKTAAPKRAASKRPGKGGTS